MKNRKRTMAVLAACAAVIVVAIAMLSMYPQISGSGRSLSSQHLQTQDSGSSSDGLAFASLGGASLATVSDDAASADGESDGGDDQTCVVEGEDGSLMASDQLILTFELGADEAAAQEQIEAGGYAIEEILDGPSEYSGSTALVAIPDGTSVEDAASELAGVDGVEAAEPDYLLEIVDDIDEEDHGQAVEALSSDDEGSSSDDAAGSDCSSSEVSDSTSATADSELQVQTTTIDDTYASLQWALDAMNVYDAWDVAKTEKAVSVAVLDTGVDYTHEDLADNVVATYCATGDKYECEADHGTHVAGIVAAKANNGTGVAGVSYDAGIVGIDVSDADGLIYTSYVIRGYQYLISNASRYNIRVVTMSLGTPGEIPEAMANQIDLAYDAGIVTICAAGNTSSSLTAPYSVWPGDYETCISVINVKGTEQSDGSYSFSVSASSNYGEDKDICAPGTRIYSTEVSDSYGYMSGTSMAAPQVAGVAALMFAANPDLSVDDLKTILYYTALDIGDEGFDEETGWGVVDACAAVELASKFCSEHMFETEVTVEPTCTEDGEATYTCSVCGYTYTEVLEATGHVEGELQIEGCTVATCTEDGGYTSVTYCTVCGEELSREAVVLPATGHSYEVVASEEVTCTEDGYATYTCSNCGDTYTEYYEATGHSYEVVASEEVTCTEDGYATYVCSVCGETYTECYEAQGHVVDGWTVVEEATLGYPGLMEKRCSTCGELLDEKEIPALVETWERLGGSDRYATMAQIVEAYCEDASCTYAVVASGSGFADALTASYAAGMLDAPLIITASDTLSEDAREQIERVGATDVLVVGGASSVSDGVLGQIAGIDGVEDVTRVGGSDRYETSALLYREVTGITGDAGSGTAIIAYGGEFADALCASPLSYASGSPILLVQSGEIPECTLDVLESGAFDEVVIVGGTSSVSQDVQGEAEQLGLDVERCCGSDRYGTSVEIAEYAIDEGMLSASTVALATGDDYPDALVGGAFCGSKGGVILLVSGSSDDGNSDAYAFLVKHRLQIDSIFTLGGESSVPEDLVEAIKLL